MKVITIGRSSKNTIVIQDASEKISRLHAEIICQMDGSLTLIDRSVNGTWVNGVRIHNNKEFHIKRSDRIHFAGISELDWKKIPTRSELSVSQAGTNFMTDIRQIMREVTADYGGVSSNLMAFWNVLKGGSTRVLSMAYDQQIGRTQAVSFYGVGLTAAVVFLVKLAPQDWIKLAHDDLFLDILYTIGLVSTTFIFAAFNYKLLKWLNHSQKRWKYYFRMFCFTFGTCFWLIALIFLPVFLFKIMTGEEMAWSFPAYFTIGCILFWTIWIWINANIKFWK